MCKLLCQHPFKWMIWWYPYFRKPPYVPFRSLPLIFAYWLVKSNHILTFVGEHTSILLSCFTIITSRCLRICGWLSDLEIVVGILCFSNNCWSTRDEAPRDDSRVLALCIRLYVLKPTGTFVSEMTQERLRLGSRKGFGRQQRSADISHFLRAEDHLNMWLNRG